MDLTTFKSEDGIEILINTETGESFCSVSGYARMSGKAKSSIHDRLKTVHKEEENSAEIPTSKGTRTVRLVTEDLITDWIVDDNPKIAKQLLKAGVRMFLHKLAGYQVTSTAIQKPLSTIELFEQSLAIAKQHEQRLANLEEENFALKQQLTEQQHLLEAVDMETQANATELERFKNGHGYWYSIAGYCNLKGVKESIQWMKSQGRKASALCRQKGISPQKVNDPRFGVVGTYPDSILEELVW